jgi:hypothetical protein
MIPSSPIGGRVRVGSDGGGVREGSTAPALAGGATNRATDRAASVSTGR